MGWTVNFGHPWAIPMLVLQLAVLVGPLLLLQHFRVEAPYMVLSVVGVILLFAAIAAFLSSRGR